MLFIYIQLIIPFHVCQIPSWRDSCRYNYKGGWKREKKKKLTIFLEEGILEFAKAYAEKKRKKE